MVRTLSIWTDLRSSALNFRVGADPDLPQEFTEKMSLKTTRSVVSKWCRWFANWLNSAWSIWYFQQSLGYSKFSVLGWSEGARSALVLTWLYPNVIENLILMGIISYPTEVNTRTILQLTADVDNWNKITFDNYLRSYKDKDEVQQLWERHMVFIADFHKHFPNGIVNKDFDPIICPVLIIHGDKVWLIQITLLIIKI